jgi:hypothetical protein
MTTPTTITDVEIFDPTNDLLERKDALAFANEIPDMHAYAFGWLTLAADFESCGLVSNAAYCRSRGEYYMQLAGGEYIKLVEGPFAEMILVEERLGTE